MELLFLGTGGAWSLPELGCDCLICREMRERGERRRGTALEAWQPVVERIVRDRGLLHTIAVAEDGLRMPLSSLCFPHESGNPPEHTSGGPEDGA